MNVAIISRVVGCHVGDTHLERCKIFVGNEHSILVEIEVCDVARTIACLSDGDRTHTRIPIHVDDDWCRGGGGVARIYDDAVAAAAIGGGGVNTARARTHHCSNTLPARNRRYAFVTIECARECERTVG